MPGVTTDAASNVARMTATLNGSFTGDGVDTSYYFEYGPTEEYGQNTPDVDHGTAAGAQTVAVNLTGLYSSYPYHYRLVAHNSYGTTYGSDQTFHTEAPDLPAVEKTFPSSIDQDSATLNAQIDPGEGLTVYRFEYGTSESVEAHTLVGGPDRPGKPESHGHDRSDGSGAGHHLLLPGPRHQLRGNGHRSD